MTLVVLWNSPALAGPTVVAMDPPAYTSQDVSAITLELSDPVVLEDANDAATYTLLDLGADRLPGGGNDTDIIIAPSYLSGTTQIQLLVVGDNTINLNAWHERDYQTGGSAINSNASAQASSGSPSTAATSRSRRPPEPSIPRK